MISAKHILLSTLVCSCVAGGVSAQASILSSLSGLSGFHGTASMYTQYIADTLNNAAVPGAIVGIWQSGRPAYLRAFGTADMAQKSPMNTRFAMPIGNITTSFTVRAALELAKAGKIQLDAPVSHYLSGVPKGNAITIANLAQMRSGLSDYTRDPSFLREVEAHPESRLSPEQLLHYSFTHPLLFKPGSRFDYSSTNTILLGLIIEKVTGKPLSRVIEDQILQPYKLRNITFSTSFADPYLQVRGYTSLAHDQKMTPVAWNSSLFWASAMMAATATNLQRWAKINADQKEFSAVIATASHSATLARTASPIHYRWGSFENNGWVGNASRRAGFESVAIYLPKQKDTIVILLNSDATENGIPVAARLAQHLSRFISPNTVYQAGENP